MTATPPFDDSVRELRQLVATGRFRDAVSYYQEQDEGWRANPEAQLLTATSATRLGDLGVAAPLAQSATDRFRQKVDRHGRMRAANLLGVVRIEQGRVAEAEEQLGEALALAHELADSLMAARVSNNLASLAHMGNRPETALSLYRGALVIYQRIGDRRGLIETYHNLGIVFRQSGQLEQAEEANENALRLAEAAEDPNLIAPALTGQAESHLAIHEIELAEAGALRAMRMAEEAGDQLAGAEAGRILALVRLTQGRPAEALAIAAMARTVAVEQQSRLLEGEVTAVCARALRLSGRDTAAEEERVAARSIFTELGAEGFLAEFDATWG
jgi:tetratricopeptide (TPR) repeat protein